MSSFALNLSPFIHSDQDFFDFCQMNELVRIERGGDGTVFIRPLLSPQTSIRSAAIGAQLWQWNHDCGKGVAFGSSAGFTLPNRAVRSPIASWMSCERWNSLTSAQKEVFAPNCPEFIIELADFSDSISDLRTKMNEYVNNGALLCWLIDLKSQSVEIYKPGTKMVSLDAPSVVLGDPILPGFSLEMQSVWRG